MFGDRTACFFRDSARNKRLRNRQATEQDASFQHIFARCDDLFPARRANENSPAIYRWAWSRQPESPAGTKEPPVGPGLRAGMISVVPPGLDPLDRPDLFRSAG